MVVLKARQKIEVLKNAIRRKKVVILKIVSFMSTITCAISLHSIKELTWAGSFVWK